MGLRLCLFAIIAMIAACERTQSPPALPSPAPSLTPAVSNAPSASVGAAPSPALSPDADEASDDDDDDIDKPWGPEFEIDADANWYFGFTPMHVVFTAKPLNGSPPFTYTWEFADGSPKATGERIEHTYEKVGQYSPFVTGTDGKGEHYTVTFLVTIVTKEEYALAKGIDPTQLKQIPPPSPQPPSAR
jgi:hypothetical protein